MQQSALTSVKAVGDEIDTTLNDLASAIIRFWLAVAVALVGFVVAVASAVATASTVVGAPVGVTIAIAAVGATAVAVNEALTDLATITTDIRDQAAGPAAAARQRHRVPGRALAPFDHADQRRRQHLRRRRHRLAPQVTGRVRGGAAVTTTLSR